MNTLLLIALVIFAVYGLLERVIGPSPDLPIPPQNRPGCTRSTRVLGEASGRPSWFQSRSGQPAFPGC